LYSATTEAQNWPNASSASKISVRSQDKHSNTTNRIMLTSN
jgi:hypothetical protein